MVNNVSHSDTANMNRLGRLYVRDGNIESLAEAKELFSLAVNEAERNTLRWWWNEGCRDYASSEEALAVYLNELER